MQDEQPKHGHDDRHHVHKVHAHHAHPHAKKDDTVTFQFTKAKLWQGIAAILGIAVIYLLFFANNGVAPAPQGGQAPQPPAAAPQGQQPTPTQAARTDVSADDDAVKGDPDAPITIIEFSDFQCPFCERWYTQTLPQLEQNYIDTGKVKLVYRDFPLSFHPEAGPAAEAAECAREQSEDAFWEFHDAIFENQGAMGSAFYAQTAADLGLDTTQFDECVSSRKYQSEVQSDFADGSAAGVSGTPSFFINGVKLVGAQPYAQFEAVIEAELANQ